MPQTISTTVYTFDELSDEAKEVAIQNERTSRANHWYFPWQDEYQDTLTAFCERFGITVEDSGRYDGTVDIKCGCYPDINGNADFWTREQYDISGESVRGLRLRTFILNNFSDVLYERKKQYVSGYGSKHRISRVFTTETCCPFTGFWADDAMLQPMRDFITNPTSKRPTYDLNDLMDDCVAAWNRAWVADCNWYLSDTCIVDDIRANEHQFTEDGELA